jgi:hypothetical protein
VDYEKLVSMRRSWLRQIDVGAWKHSWHLPKTNYGIDWNNPKTLEDVLAVLNHQVEEARQTIRDVEPMQIQVMGEIERLKVYLSE